VDKIILSSKDTETLLKWRDNNKEYVRQNAAPFKSVLLVFPDAKINIKTINNDDNITFYINIDGTRAGKLTVARMPWGFLKVIKNTTKLTPDDIQSIITVFSSLMALIVYYEPEPDAGAETITKKPLKNAAGKKNPRRPKNNITYILKSNKNGLCVLPRGKHASPAGVFGVRGHFRQYKDGRRVWIKPYKKGTGKNKSKTYKL
jgi:hypothetical protein